MKKNLLGFRKKKKFKITFLNKYLNQLRITQKPKLRNKQWKKPRWRRLRLKVREKKEGRDVEAEVASEVSTAAEKGQRQAEGAKDALEVVENIAAVVVVTGLDRRMKTVSSSRLVTNPSQGEEVAEVASLANVENG